MRPKTLPIVAAVAVLALGSAFSQSLSAASPQKHDGLRNILFVSPAGKPFRSDTSQSDQHPMILWFSVVDEDGDGTISPKEFRSDFGSTFAEYDNDGNEQIDAFEVRHYEQEIFPEITRPTIGGYGRSRSKGGASSRPRRGKGEGRSGKGQRGSKGGGKDRAGISHNKTSARPVGGAARFGLLPIYHPLLDADADISWRVSKAEFMKAADDRFKLLDTDLAGVLTLEVLRQKLPKPRKRSRKDQ